MYKTKQTIFALTVLTVIGFSFSTMFCLVQGSTDAEPFLNQINKEGTPIPSFGDVISEGIFVDYNFGFNATASVNRTVQIEQFGVASIIDNIELEIIGNENITYFNYTLPNINTDKLVFASFRVSNTTLENILSANATRSYSFNRLLNYTTFVVPLHTNLNHTNEGEIYYISAYLEFSLPFTYSIYNNEQLLHYKELLYPLINNIQIANSSKTRVNKQGNDIFIDDNTYKITPRNTSNVILVNQAEQNALAWSNISREPFNYSQDYSDDLLMNVYTSSVSTAEAVEQAANTLLFKASEINRKIEIDPYGLVKITEKQTIVFLGPEKPEGLSLTEVKLYALNAFPLILPENATVLELYDDLGGLNLPYRINDDNVFERGAFNIRESIYPNHPALVIFPRSPLFNGDKMTFTIIYKVPIDVVLAKEEGSINYKLKLSPTSLINWTTDVLNLEVVLPKGAVYKSFEFSDPDPYQPISLDYHKVFVISSLGFKRVFRFSALDFSGGDNAQLTIYFSYSRLNMIIPFFLQVITIGIIFGIYLGIRWTGRRVQVATTPESEKEFIPVAEIEEFVKQYEEILSLRERLRETRAKIRSKKLKAKEGKDLQQKLEKRLREEEDSLKKTKENLVKHGGRYKDAVQKIEIAERRLIEERRNQMALQQEYRVKKSMTKESYVKLFRDRQQNIERLRNEIESILVGLRMLLEP